MTNSKTNKVKLILLTPLFFLLTHYIALFFHEYTHSFTAWLLGYKTNPLALNYGGNSWLNLLLLIHIDEDVDYDTIFFIGHPHQAAFIAFAAPLIGNGLLFILSDWLLSRSMMKQHLYFFYFLFLLNLMNLGNFYDYIPIRTFATQGDMYHIVMGLAISPWWIYILGGYGVTFLIWRFFKKTLISAFNNLHLNSIPEQASLMIISVATLFGFFAIPGLFRAGELSFLFSVTSFLAIPGILLALWPTRTWIKLALKEYISKNC